MDEKVRMKWKVLVQKDTVRRSRSRNTVIFKLEIKVIIQVMEPEDLRVPSEFWSDLVGLSCCPQAITRRLNLPEVGWHEIIDEQETPSR